MVTNVIDPYFRVELLSATPNPQTVIYAALHQDYSSEFVHDEQDSFPSETKCGDIAVNRLLKSKRFHCGPLEHPQIVFNCGWFPHSTMQQVRTHRLLSFDVMSGRYTGQQICDVALGKEDVESVFYLRPIGTYTNRQGKHYEYTEVERNIDKDWVFSSCQRYWYKLSNGMSEEHARSMIPFDVRQHWVMSMNMRSLIHLLTIRGKKDAQLECQQLCELILPHFKAWAPEIYDWFYNNQWQKGTLAP